VTAHVLISRSCPNDCIFCAVADKRRAGSFPKPEEIRRFIAERGGEGGRTLALSGLGEPSLDPDLDSYIGLARASGFEAIVLFTNGAGVDLVRARRWKDEGLTGALVSIHGLRDGHDASCRRRGSWDEAMAALDVFRDLELEVSVNSCATTLNLGELPGLCELLDGGPLVAHSLSFPEWSGNAAINAALMPNYIDMRELASLIPPSPKRFFDNLPPCIVRFATVGIRRDRTIDYLDGGGALLLDPSAANLSCPHPRRGDCAWAGRCPGFDREYVARRGWSEIRALLEPEIVEGAKPAELGPENSRPKGRWRGSGSPGICAVVKPTVRCNARCGYCSNAAHPATRDMDIGQYRRLADQLVEMAAARGAREATVLWHGGEPLLLGKEFFRAAFAYRPISRGAGIRHLIQTNLLLFDEEWASIFSEAGVPLSSSVDPFDSGSRLMPDGSPQYPLWFAKFGIASKAGLRLGVVFTATSAHARSGAEVYAFLSNLSSLTIDGIGVRVNAVYPEGRAERGTFVLEPEDHLRFFSDLAAAWERDGRSLALSPFTELAKGENLPCDLSGACWEGFVGVDGEGRVAACGRELDVGAFIGKLDGGLAPLLTKDFLDAPGRRRAELLAGPCADCEAWSVCHGSCRGVAASFSGDGSHPWPYCRTMREVYLPLARRAGP